MPGSTHDVLTVTSLNEYIKMMIDGNPKLASVYVKGEISNFTNHYKTGHFYFTLKDEGSLISAVMFKSAASKLKFLPENGMKVIIRGRVSAYIRDGRYQLYAEGMEPDGIGALYIAYEQLRKRLEAEGLFAPELKRPLPKIPRRVGIITSPTGAAVRDMINVTGRRFPYAELVLFPAQVQGDSAVPQLIEGIRYFGTKRSVDVIIIGRGGGSIEDLWAFNSEELAREIAKCPIPVISAVGHETDFTICDFAADRRAPTPSAAAELAVPETTELKRKVGNITSRMELLLESRVAEKRARLKLLSEKRVMTSPQNFVDDKRLAVLNLSDKLELLMSRELEKKKSSFASLSSVLNAVNPLRIISRGYSAVFSGEGKLIKSVDDVEVGQNISFKTIDGDVTACVKEKIKNSDSKGITKTNG